MAALPSAAFDECLDGRDHLVVFQRLADRGRGVAVVDLDDHVLTCPRRSSRCPRRTRVPQPRTEEDGADHDHDQRRRARPLANRPAPAAATSLADPVRTAHSTPRRAHRHGLCAFAAPVVRHRRPLRARPRPRAADPASSAVSRRPRPGRSSPSVPLARTPASRSERCAVTVVSRSSAIRTGVGATRRASCSARLDGVLRGRTGPVGERTRQSDHHLDRLQFVDELRQPSQVLRSVRRRAGRSPPAWRGCRPDRSPRHRCERFPRRHPAVDHVRDRRLRADPADGVLGSPRG